MAERGFWLYAVGREPVPETLTGLAGVGGESVHALPADGLFAAASPVSLHIYGADALKHNLEDLDWLAVTARAHDAVIAALSSSGPVVPMRLATVYADAEGVTGMLHERHDEFADTLQRLDGRTEWGVKAYVAPAAEAEAPNGTFSPSGEAASAGAGTAYLQRRKAQLSAREAAASRAEADAQQVHAALAELAVATRRNPAQAAQLSGIKATMVLNGSYLVDDSRSDVFAARVKAEQAERPAVRLELTGPWPPYSFAGVEPERADDRG